MKAGRVRRLYLGETALVCPACLEVLWEDYVRNLVELVLEEANPGMLRELREEWKAREKGKAPTR